MAAIPKPNAGSPYVTCAGVETSHEDFSALPASNQKPNEMLRMGSEHAQPLM